MRTWLGGRVKRSSETPSRSGRARGIRSRGPCSARLPTWASTVPNSLTVRVRSQSRTSGSISIANSDMSSMIYVLEDIVNLSDDESESRSALVVLQVHDQVPGGLRHPCGGRAQDADPAATPPPKALAYRKGS